MLKLFYYINYNITPSKINALGKVRHEKELFDKKEHICPSANKLQKM
jgi:hypothetical protein